jgi:DNA-binding NarL/FixJ family response regulator
MVPRVLIVDDVQETRSILRLLLEEEGIRVIGEAGDGIEACRMAAQLSPDVVLMDLSMPEMDGMDATTRIKREMPRIQVVILTSDDSPHLTRWVEEVGAFSYLLKDCPAQLIIDEIRNAAERKRADLKSLPGARGAAEPTVASPSVTTPWPGR